MRQEVVEVEVDNKEQVEEVEGKVNNRQGRRLGEAEGIAAYNRVDTPFAVPGLEELDGISPVTKAPRKISKTNRRIRPVSTSRKVRPSTTSRKASRQPSSRSFPRFSRPAFHNLPRFPASFPAETPPTTQAAHPFNQHPQAIPPQASHPQALHPQAPQGFPAVPRNFLQVNPRVQPPHPSFPIHHQGQGFPHQTQGFPQGGQGFPLSEGGSLPGRSF